MTSTAPARRCVRANGQSRNPHRGAHPPPPVPAGLGLEPGATHGNAETEAAGYDREDAHVHARAHRAVNGHPAGALIVVKTKGLLLVLVMSAGPYVHLRGDGNESVWTKMG